jgi:hypothetical protein
MTKDEALKMAIEALNDSLTRFSTFNEMQHDAIQACIDALEQPAWQGLTDDEITKVYKNSLIVHSDTHYEFNNFKFARAIEQALKDKNHG